MTWTRWLLAVGFSIASTACVDDNTGEGEGESAEGEGEGEGEGEVEQFPTCVIAVTPEAPHAVGSTVSLSSLSSAARPGGSIISVQWVLIAFPADATVGIVSNTVTTDLLGDVAGTFTIGLRVTDDSGFETSCQTDVVFE